MIRDLFTECGRIARASRKYFIDSLSKAHFKKCDHVQMLIPETIDTVACARALVNPFVIKSAFVLVFEKRDLVSQLIEQVDSDRGPYIFRWLDVIAEQGSIITFSGTGELGKGLAGFDVEYKKKGKGVKARIVFDMTPSASLQDAVAKSLGPPKRLCEDLEIDPPILDPRIVVVPQYKNRSTEEVLKLFENVENVAHLRRFHLLLINRQRYSDSRIISNFEELQVDIEEIADYILNEPLVSKLPKTLNRDELLHIVKESSFKDQKLKELCEQIKRKKGKSQERDKYMGES